MTQPHTLVIIYMILFPVCLTLFIYIILI